MSKEITSCILAGYPAILGDLEMSDDIFVTKPHLPPLSKFVESLETIWESGVLSNEGPYAKQLEADLAAVLKVEHVSLFNNGTTALITALRALDITGEVITTPFSFIATAHSILWNGNTPVFVDIDKDTLNIDPSAIEAAITPNTAAIMPVHCYGYPADVDAIEEIANRYGLKVIYDAAHAFGVECHCGSLLAHGDTSVLSFHATKVFNTFEGGAIVSKSAAIKARVDQLKNFGHAGETEVVATGLNGKMSEINAAFGLLQLQHVDDAIKRRQEITLIYQQALRSVEGVRFPSFGGAIKANYSYLPVRIGPDYHMSRDALYLHMKANGVHPRRYFYPLIPEFEMYRRLSSADLAALPNAFSASREILCLPIFPAMTNEMVERIISLIKA